VLGVDRLSQTSIGALTAISGTISNELYQSANLALLCEDLVNGMIAAAEWGGSPDPSVPMSNDVSQRNPHQLNHRRRRDAVEIIMDIEHYDWDFKVQAGALRRVIMKWVTSKLFSSVLFRELQDTNSSSHMSRSSNVGAYALNLFFNE